MRLIEELSELKKSSLRSKVDKRLREFKSLGKKHRDEIFKELCFCIMTANFTAERGIKIQQEIGNDFLSLSEEQLAKRLKACGHRFPNTRANYIAVSREKKEDLDDCLCKMSEPEIRDWLAKNIKGLGYKEASHFMRNIGYDNVAIIDFHIVDLLVKHNLIKKPKTLSKKNYLEIEDLLLDIAKKAGMTLAELDLYLWYMETGKILK